MAAQSSSSYEDSTVPQKDIDRIQTPPSQFVAVKVYDHKEQLTLHRLSASTTFTCGHCNTEKKSKLVITYQNRWDDLRCNACYGKLLLEDLGPVGLQWA